MIKIEWNLLFDKIAAKFEFEFKVKLVDVDVVLVVVVVVKFSTFLFMQINFDILIISILVGPKPNRIPPWIWFNTVRPH